MTIRELWSTSHNTLVIPYEFEDLDPDSEDILMLFDDSESLPPGSS